MQVATRHLFRVCLILLTFCFVNTSSSQFDTQFWMPPIWETGNSGQNQPSELFITTSNPSPVSVHIETPDGTTYVLDTVVVAGTPLQIPLTPTLAQTDVENAVIVNNGFVVTSSYPIQCVHKVSGQFNQTLVTLKGTNGRGTDFWCGSQVRNMNATYGPNEHHFISVMAMEDNTTITLDTPFDMFLAGPGDLANPYVLTLDQHECYLIRGDGPIEYVCGSHVTADKEIVVISGSTHTRIAGGGAADGGTDQLVPIGLQGTDYVVIKGDNDNPFDYAMVVATEDNTDVFIDGNGTAAANIDAGEYYDYTLTGGVGEAHRITTDKIAYCYHVTGASQDDEVGMSAIPQTDCTGSRYIEFSKFEENVTNQSMNIIAPADAVPTLALNGVGYASVPGVITDAVPGLAGWLAVTFPESSLASNNVVTSDGFFHVGFLTGNGGSTGTYGFLSGFDDAFEFIDPNTGLPSTVYILDTLCPGESVDHCFEVYSCAFDHNIESFSGNEGTVVITPPTSPFDTCFSYTAPFDFVGNDTVNFVVSNVFGFEGDIDVVVVTVDPDTPIDAGPVQELCSETTAVLSAIDPDPLVDGFWTLLNGTATIEDPNSPTTNVTGIALGTNTFLWTQPYPCQDNFAITQIIVYDGTAPDADAGPDIEICSDGNTLNMDANDPLFTATGTWEIIQGTATIWDINDPNSLVTNLGIGENIFEWNIDNGPCPGGATVDAMSIFVFDQNHPPSTNSGDQEFCSDVFVQADVTGNEPVFPATGEWVLISGSGDIDDPTDFETFITNCGVGENVFEWQITNGPCTPITSSLTITIYDNGVASANAGDDAQYCTPTTDHVMNATDPGLPATGTWTLISGSGAIADAGDPATSISNLGIGDNVFRWTIDNGPCANTGDFDEVTITIFDGSQDDADAGPDQEFCSSTFVDTQLDGSELVPPGSGTWSVINGSGVFVDENDPNTDVSGLSVGTNTFQWTVGNGPCGFPTFDQVVVTLFDDNQPAADAGPDVSFCTPISTHVMAAVNPSPPSQGEWTLESGTGTISDINDPNADIAGLGIGENVFRWTIVNGPCPGGLNFDEISIFIYDENAPIAEAGPDQEFCSDPAIPVEAFMDATPAIFPGTGVWTTIQGSGSIADVNDPNTSIIGLGVGENIFEWTIDNGPCDPSVTSDQVSIFVFPFDQADADAGPDQTICSDDPNSTLAGNSVTFPASGEWTLVAGSATITDPTDPTTTVTDLAVGSNTFMWTIDNGPCIPSTTFDQITILVFDASVLVADAGADQNICSDVDLAVMDANPSSAPATASWVVILGSGTFSDDTDPDATVTGMTIGENIFEWVIDNGPCSGTTTDQVSVFLFDDSLPAADAGPDQSLCSDVTTTTLAGSAVVFPATGLWELVSGTGTFVDDTDPTTDVTGLSVGENIFRWNVSNGPCTPSVTSDLVSIFLYDENILAADAGADQEFCSQVSSTTLTGNSFVFPATGMWTLVSGTGTIASPSQASTLVTDLSVGENVFEWTIDNGPCPNGVTSDQISIFIYDQTQPDADAGPDQIICTPQSSIAMAGSSITFPGSGLWTLISGSGTIVDDTNPTTDITGLPLGIHVFEWAVDNGPCGAPTTAQVTITVYDDTAVDADAGPDQDTCTPITSVTMAGSAPVFPGTGTWTLISGSGTIVDDSAFDTQIDDLAIGENVFEWTIDNGPCAGGLTSDQVSIFVFPSDQDPAAAGPDQDICSDDDLAFLSANAATFPATSQWTVIQGSGVFSDDTSPTSQVTGMTVGENIFEWTISNPACGVPTTDQVSIFLYDTNQPASDAGPDQNLCTPTLSTTMDGLVPTYPATGTWQLVSGTGTITDASDPTTGITDLAVGENVFSWTIDNGPCLPSTTVDLVSIFVFDGTALDADAGADQEFCTPTSSTTLVGNSFTFPATAVWTLVSGSGTITDPTNPATTVTDLLVGENIFEWTIDNGPCGVPTSDQVSIFIFDQNQGDADAGPDQEFCSPTSTATLAGNAITFPASGTWTLVSGTGAITSPNDPNSGVTGLTIGENIFEWTVDNGPCGPVTTDQVSIFIFDDLAPDADAGPDQELCTPTTSTSMAANTPILPAIGIWTLISGSGSIIDVNDPNTVISGLAVGANVFEWTVDNGNCAGNTTSDQVTIFVYFDGQLAANAGPDQDLCTPQTSTFLAANSVTFPATGTWTLISGTATIVDPSDPNTEITGIAIGVNVFEWTIDNGPCVPGITSDQVTITLFDGGFPPPDAGPDQELCSPVSTTNMAAEAAVPPGEGTWSLFSGSGSVTDVNDPNSGVTGLAIGINTFVWTLGYATCGQPTDTVNIIVYDNSVPPAQAGPDQEICTPTNTATMAADAVNAPGYGTWSLVSGNGTINDVNDPASGIDNLTVGENVFVWTVYNGPCLVFPSTVDTMSIFVFDNLQLDADAGEDQSYCSPTSTTLLEGNSVIFPASGTWTLVSGTGVPTDPNDPNTEVTGLTIGENIFEWTIDNGPCGAPTSDQVSIFIYDDAAPDADAGPDQEICTPDDSVTMAANSASDPAIGTWTLISGSGTIGDPNDPTTLITDLTVGVSIFQWTIDNDGCSGGLTSDLVSIFVFDENQPDADAGPDQDICTPQSSVTLQGNAVIFPAIGTWTLVSGAGTIVNPNNPNTVVNDLVVGVSVFEWTISNGPCANALTSDQVTISVFDGGAPPPDAGPDQELCSPTTTTNMAAVPAVDPGIGTWTLVSGTGSITDVNDPLTEITNLSIGINTFVWSVDYSTCGLSTDTVSIILYDSTVPPADAGPDQEFCFPTTSTNMAADPVAPPGYGTWSLFSGTGNVVDVNDPASAVDGLAIGENIFVWEVYNGPCLLAPFTTDTMSIFIFDNSQEPADAGPDQFLCTPTSSTFLEANAALNPAIGTWVLVSGTGVVTDPNDPTSEVTGLTVGENIFEWTIDNSACPGAITQDSVSIFVYDENQDAADAGPDQEFCTPISSTTLEGNAVTFPGVGTWVLISGSGTILSPNDPGSVVTDLAVGENIFEWTIDNGPCGDPTTDLVSIFVFEQFNEDADAGPDQELCLPETSTNLEGNTPIFPAIGTWTLSAGTGIIANENDPGTFVSGLSVGENVFVWTVDNGPCANGITTDTVSVFVFDDTAPLADAGPDQEFCSPTSETFMDATPALFPGQGTWILVSGTGTIVDPNDPTTQITDLSIGENIFEWTVYNGPCPSTNSTDLVSIFIFDENQPDADAGPDQALCFPLNFTSMAANDVIFPATGEWTLIQGAGTIIDPTFPGTGIIDLEVGDNIFVWTIFNGPCANAITTDTMTISVFDNLLIPADAGPDQEFCLPDNFATLDGSPLIAPATGLWTQIQGSGNILDPTSNITGVVDLAVTENIFVWTVDNGVCGTTMDTMSVFIYDPLAEIADAGPNQFFCTPISTTTMDGNVPDDPGVGTWELVSGDGTIDAPNDPFSEISGLTIGENIFSWTIYNGPCADPTVDHVSIFIYDENAPPAYAGEDMEICLPLDSIMMQADGAIFPAQGIWTLINGTGDILDVNDPNSWITGLTLGTNTFIWTIDNTPCPDGITMDTVNVLVFEENIAPPYAGDDQEFCSPISTTVLDADELADPNTGVWTVIDGAGVFGDETDPNTIVSGMVIGINTFVWNVYNGPCLNSNFSDTVSVYIFDEAHPPADAGEDQELCLPLNTTILNGNTPTVPATGTWELIEGSATINDVNDPNTLVTELALGINSFTWTIANGPCENTMTTDTVTVFVFEEGADPADAGPDIEICTPESCVTLQAEIPSIPTTGTWEILLGNPTISDVNDPNAELCALGVGQYTLQWTIYNGPCEENNSFDFVDVFVYDATAPPAAAGDDQELCWPDDATTMDAETPVFPALGTWDLIQGSGSLADVNDPNTAYTDLSIGTNILTWTVYNGPCNEATIDTVLVSVFDPNSPDADAGPDQYFCTPFGGANMDGSVPLPPALGTWQLISGSGEITNENEPGTSVFDLGLGENIFVWSIYNGACPNGLTTDTVSIFVNDLSVAAADAGPDQFFCGVLDSLQMQGSETIGNTAFGTWTTIQGGGDFFNIENEFTFVYDIPLGVNIYVWTVDNGACGISSDTVEIVLYDPDLPPAFAGVDENICEDDFFMFPLDATPAPYPATGFWEIFEGDIEISDPLDPNSDVLTLGEIIEPFSTITNTLVWTVDNGVCGLSTDSVTFILEDCVSIEVPDAFSPNNDGVNDVFEIPNLWKYPDNSIKIFNRWGMQVYEAAPYNEDWDGRSQHASSLGTELPVSTYYYILSLGDGSEAFTGWIYLKR
jgi:gliding motility-associated-like protein